MRNVGGFDVKTVVNNHHLKTRLCNTLSARTCSNSLSVSSALIDLQPRFWGVTWDRGAVLELAFLRIFLLKALEISGVDSVLLVVGIGDRVLLRVGNEVVLMDDEDRELKGRFDEEGWKSAEEDAEEKS